MALQLKNPHSVIAALRERPQEVLEVCLPKTVQPSDPWGLVAKLAREHKIREGRGAPLVQSKSEKKSDTGGRMGVTSANVRERQGISLEELFEDAKERSGGHGLWLALDQVQDPHNVGAIFRTAAFFGVQGIIVTDERSAPLSSTVYDIASGGMEYVPFVLQTNLQQALDAAKEAGVWVLGTSEHARDEIVSIGKDRPWLVVLGNEEKGIRRLTEENCDVLCKVAPASDGVTSLNVSVAAGIFMARLA